MSMSLTLPVAELMLREALHRPFCGRALVFGRSTVPIEPDTMDALFRQVSFQRPQTPVEFDNVTHGAKQYPQKRFVTDTTFLRWLGLERIDVLDVSDYEGADIVHDICRPLPPELQGQYDFVFNSSVLDNVFDPAAALRHMTSALRPGGRIFHLEMASNDAFPYLVFTPGWFQDYYAVNRFERCQVYLAQFQTIEELIFGPWTVWGCLPLVGQQLSAPALKGAMATVLGFAERGKESTIDKSPIQGHYRSAAHQAAIDEGMRHFARASLPFHVAPGTAPGTGRVMDAMQWQWVSCGMYGRAVGLPSYRWNSLKAKLRKLMRIKRAG
jgi:SAM-dependent methyltransferase